MDPVHIVLFREPQNPITPHSPTQHDPYYQVLSPITATLQYCPVLGFEYLNQEELRHNLLPCRISSFSAILCTSARGIDSIVNVIEGSPQYHPDQEQSPSLIDRNRLYNMPLFVVGKGTNKFAEHAGFTNTFLPADDVDYIQHIQQLYDPSFTTTVENVDAMSTKQNAVHLGHYLVYLYKYKVPQTVTSPHLMDKHEFSSCFNPDLPILILSSQIRQPTLTSILSQHGVPFVEMFTYTTTPSPNIFPVISDLLANMNTSPSYISPGDQHEVYCVKNCPTFMVYFSPSGLLCIMAHLTVIFNYLSERLKTVVHDHDPHQHTSGQCYIDNNASMYTALLKLLYQHIPIAIGATTKKDIEFNVIPQITRYQTALALLYQQINFDGKQIMRHLVEMYDTFQSITFQPLLTCIEPSPNGIYDQIMRFINKG